MTTEVMALLVFTNVVTWACTYILARRSTLEMTKAVVESGCMPVVLAYLNKALGGVEMRVEVANNYKSRYEADVKRFRMYVKGKEEHCDCPKCTAEREKK